MPNLRDTLMQEILPNVEKPSRYLGSELNSVHKDPDSVNLRVCLFFPDLYELGLGNLGLHILYAILNDMDGVWAERGYSPAPDLEAALRERDLPLFLYESKDELRAADLIGFTLQSELTYTNILNALDLARIPLRSAARGEDDPLIFGGGPTAYNPEPMAPFFDFFVIGDGEDAVVDLVNTLRALGDVPRRQKLEAISRLDGFYVPALYPMETLPDGRIVPPEDAPKITRRVVRDLDAARYPTRYIVPYTQLVHDGIGLEVLRGCTQGCRFCQAGMVTRPVRERSLEKVGGLMGETLDQTGLEAVSLVSLSTCDHSRVRSLVHEAASAAHPRNVSVSLPSLRLDSFSVELADMVAGVRRSGLTFAPEAATPRLRAVINKFIPDEDLLNMAAQAFSRGWTSIKTYFMIGLPTERDEDVEAIADLCRRALDVGRAIQPRAKVRTGVSTFVPTPWTPFQWAPQIGIEETERRQRILAERFRGMKGVKFGRHEPETSFIEGLLSRADRRAADLIEAAWRHGARLESWDEHVDIAHWRAAIAETGCDADAHFAGRDFDARLPWDHIDVLVTKEWLREDCARAMQLQHAQDCRANKCHQCGVIGRVPKLCGEMLKRQRRGRREEKALWENAVEAPPQPARIASKEGGETTHPGRLPAPPPEEAAPREPLQRIRFRIGRGGEARLLSHLEMQSAWIRTLRRAGAPLAYSQGFHAHPKLNFATAAPLGEESEGDFMDVLLDQFMPPEELLAHVRDVLPPGFQAYAAEDVPLRGASLMSLADGFQYRMHVPASTPDLAERIAQLLAAPEVLIDRRVKAGKARGRGPTRKKVVPLNIRPMIAALGVRPAEDGAPVITFSTREHEGRVAKPKEILTLLGIEPGTARVVKEAVFLRDETL